MSGWEFSGMDVLEQAEKALKDSEARVYQRWKEHEVEDGAILAELVSRYNQYVALRRWDSANEFLSVISRLVIAMLAE